MAGIKLLTSELNSKELDTLPSALKCKIEVLLGSKVTELEDLKGKFEKLKVNHEQQYFELEKQLINNTSQLEAETAVKTDLLKKLAAIEKEHDEAKSKLLKQEEEISTAHVRQLELSNANQLLEAEKRDLSSFLEKRDKNIQRLKDDLKELNDKLSTANKDKCNAQAELMKVQTTDMSRQYHEKRLQQEKDQLQKQVDWLNAQLSDKTKEFVTFRREKAGKLLEVQGSLEEKTEEIAHLRATIEALKSSREEQSSKIETLAQKLKEARDLQTTADEQYRQELAAQSRLINLYKASAEENNKKITELTRAVEELQKLLKEANSAYSQFEAMKAEEVNKLSDDIKERDLKIENLERAIHNANDLLAAKKSGALSVSQDEVETIYSSAAATSKLLKSGMTLTQIYSEYMQAVENLETQKEENKRLNSYLDQILQEIEDKAPQLKKQREDYESALQTLDQLTPQLDAAMLECEKLRSDNEELKRRANYFQRENTRIQQCNIDLSRQVKFLLKEIQEVKGGFMVPDDETEVSSSQDVSCSSRIITEKLVTFRNIHELQEKNQQLLESLRDLSKRREDEEAQATDAKVTELEQQLEIATQELEQLRSDRTRHAEMVEAIVRQRDMYRVLLQQGGSVPVRERDWREKVSPNLAPITSTPVPSTSGPCLPDKSLVDTEKTLNESKMALKELQAEYNTYRREKIENEKILNEQLEMCRTELSESRVQNTRLASQLDHAAERYKILQSNAECYRKEIAALQDRCQKYSTSVAKHELTITKLKEDVFEKQQLVSTWEAKVEHQRAQYDVLHSHEQHLLAEVESLHRERQSQAMLTANLQAIQNNLERAEFESKSRYTNQIDSLEKEVALLRRKLECAEEEKSTSISSLETSLKSSQAELATAKELQEQFKIEAENAKKELQDSLNELSTTESKLIAAERKLSTLGTAEGDFPTVEAVKDLKNEIVQLKQHLKNQQVQLKAARQQAEQYKAISEGIEQNLKHSNQTSKEFQEACETKMIEALNAKEALEKRVEQLENDHQKLLNENIRMTEDHHILNNDLRKQLTSLRHELQEAIQMRETALVEQTKAQQTLQQQADLASEAQDKYQRELILHAADVEALTALKTQLESHNDDLAKAQAEIQAEQQKFLNAQTSWQEQERVLREECRQLETRCTDLEKQNSTLHTQMETLSAQAIAMQQKSSEEPLNLSLSEEAGKSSEQLLEVIKFLRREKEIAEAKLEVTESSSARLQQRLASLAKQLEEAKQSLNEERQQNQTSIQTMFQHVELMRKVETVNLLQESNKLLREENNRLLSLQQEMEVKVRRLEEEISPLQVSVRELTAQKDLLEVEKKTLAAEAERWKSRTHHLVEQSNKTDPEEHRKLMQEKDQIRKQLAQSKEELHKVRAELSRANAVVSSKESDLSAQKQEFNKQFEELQETRRLLGEEQKEGEKKINTINQLKKIGRKYKEQSETIQKELDQLKASSAGQQTQQNTAAAEAEHANKQLMDRLAVIEKERDELKALMTQKEEEITSLKEQIQKVQQDLAQHQQDLQKLQADSIRLQTENTRLQADSVEMEKKQTQARTVLQNARTRITQQKEQIDRLVAENNEIKSKATADNSQMSKAEEGDQRVAQLKLQYDQQIAQLQRAVEEARQRAESAVSEAPIDQHYKERVVAENLELQSKVQQLQRQVEILSKSTPTQSTPRQTTSSGTSPTSAETPKMASIKPVATAAAAPAMQHTSSQAKATASIRPMAIASANTGGTSLPPYPSTSTPPIVTVMPTTVVQPEPQQDDQPSTSGLQQTTISAVSVTGRPQQQVQIVTPQIESVEPSTSADDTSAQVVVAPGIQESVHTVQSAQQQQPLLQASASTTSGTATTLTGPSVSGDQAAVALGKRIRDDTETSEETEAKRSRTAQSQQGSHLEREMQNAQDANQDDDSKDIIVVNSDEEICTGIELEGHSHEFEGQQQISHLEEEDIEDETEEEGDSEDLEEEEFIDEDEQEREELDEEGMPSECVGDEDDENDVVIIDIDETETPATSQSLATMEAEEDVGSSSVTTTTSIPRPPPPLQPVSAHTERIPSTSRQLTPFLLGHGGAFDEDDCTVPSTPTLSMPRRNDGFAEALNSPHVAQRFVFSGASEGASQPELAQLESQRALGMDDTRMDLSQFDEGGVRSIPTTPVPQVTSSVVSENVTPQASITTTVMSQPSCTQDNIAVTTSSTTEVTSAGQVETQDPLTPIETSEQKPDPNSEASGSQVEEESEASLLESAAGDDEDDDDSKSASKPRIQRIVWDSQQSSGTLTTSTSVPQHPQQQESRGGFHSGGLRQGAVPTRPNRGAAPTRPNRGSVPWRGPRQPRQRGMAHMRGGPRGGYRGQF